MADLGIGNEIINPVKQGMRKAWIQLLGTGHRESLTGKLGVLQAAMMRKEPSEGRLLP